MMKYILFFKNFLSVTVCLKSAAFVGELQEILFETLIIFIECFQIYWIKKSFIIKLKLRCLRFVDLNINKFWIQILVVFRPIWLFRIYFPVFCRESSRECTLVNCFRSPLHHTSTLVCTCIHTKNSCVW